MKRKYLYGFLVILLIFLFIAPGVNAGSFKFQTNPSKTTLKPGEEVTISLKVSDIVVDSDGINVLEAKMEYDESIFEHVSTDDVKSLNNWSITYNDENTESKGKMICMILSAGVKVEQEIGTITLKVRSDLTSNVSTKETKVNFINIASNDGASTINETDKQNTFIVKFDNVSGQEPTNPTNNEITNNSIDVTSNIVKGTNTKDNTIANGSVPQTGTNESIYVVGIAVLIFSIVGSIIGYKKII